MKETHILLSKRYASSFIEAFGVHCEWLPSLSALADLFTHNRSMLIMLSLPSISPEEKIDAMHTIFDQIPFAQEINRLIRLLLTTKRVMLLGIILREIVEEYYRALDIVRCTVTSSHPLVDTDKAIIQDFISRNIGHTSMCVYKIDPSLIAGVRVQTDTTLWEYSIRKQLRTLHTALVR